MVNLEKGGQTVNLSKDSAPVSKTTVGLGWVGKDGKNLDLDSYVALRDAQGKNVDFVYFSNMRSEGVKHHGDDLTGGGGSDSVNEMIDVNLEKLPSNVTEVICGLFIYSGASSLNQVDSAFVKITDSKKNKDLVKYDIKQSFGSSKSVVVGKLVRNGSEWDFVSIGESSNEGYRDIKNKYTSNRSSNTGSNTGSGSSDNGGFFGRVGRLFS